MNAAEPSIVLAARVGTADPYAEDAVSGGKDWDGPVLTAAGILSPVRILLLAPAGFETEAAQTALALRDRLPAAQVELVPATGAWAEIARAIGLRLGPGQALRCIVEAGGTAALDFWRDIARNIGARHIEGLSVSPRTCVADPPASCRSIALDAGAATHGFEARLAYRVEAASGAFAPGWDAARATNAGATPTPPELIGANPAFRQAVVRALAIAPHSEPILLGGETGTGKGLLARAIHAASGRPANAFVAVNCSGVPEPLAESLLFGHRKGSFTGAHSDQPGVFERADGGTLFLDEVGELPLSIQPKLLKVLDDGLVEALGSGRPRAVNVRVIAATHRNLRDLVAARTFREDLYYRLSVLDVRLPSLRERRDDIAPLALSIVRELTRGSRTARRVTRDALARLEQHDWPGNIRELRNVISRSLLFSTRAEIDAGDLLFDPPATTPQEPDSLPTPREGFSLEVYLSDARRRLIQHALSLTGGNQSAAARLLDVSPQAIHKFLKTNAPPANPG